MQTRVVIPQGDLGGIGPEVALSVCADSQLRARCRPLLLGHLQALRQIAEECQIEVELQAVDDAEAGFAVDPEQAMPVLELESPLPADPAGQPAASFGAASVEANLRAGVLCMEKRADALVTPPIHKESMHLAGYPYEGQTQIFGELCRSRRYGMLACNGKLQVLLATRHMALRDALKQLEPNLVAKQIRIAHQAARQVLGLEEPRIVLAGLNPHAGEGGAFGDEETRVLQPGIAMALQDHGLQTAGPAVPDAVFLEAQRGDWDIVIALYHDQAFIPLKLLGRDQAYTIFVGGPILRVSPMHGAAYDIARSGKADAQPFRFTMEQALRLSRLDSVVA